MAKARSPNRDIALDIYLQHKGDIANRRIADLLDEKEKTISNWKSRDSWNVVLQTGERSTTKRIESNVGAPEGNQNALGNDGGAPKGNANAVTHGFFSKYMPPESLAIMKEIETMQPIDMLWDQITIQYTAIIRAQQIMYVKNRDDLTTTKIEEKFGNVSGERWEVQHAWDKQASFLQAQSRAMSELRSLIRSFMQLSDESDERRLKLVNMQLDINKKKIELKALGDGDNKDKPIIIDDIGGEDDGV